MGPPYPPSVWVSSKAMRSGAVLRANPGSAEELGVFHAVEFAFGSVRQSAMARISDELARAVSNYASADLHQSAVQISGASKDGD